MAPPSSLQIAVSSLQRLIKEEASYHKEMDQQKSRIAKLEATKGDKADGDGNEEFELRQEVCSLWLSLITALLEENRTSASPEIRGSID